MFRDYSHFLAYGSTDQETLRELTEAYQGLLVPGTYAAYQADGTKGFVLTLSAAIKKPYAIDPRTPLFQYHNPAPKQSHISLARVLGIDKIVEKHGFVPLDAWTPEQAREVAEAWIRFNSAYTSIAPKQFEKYAKRLGRQLDVQSAESPDWILAPYLMITEGGAEMAVNKVLWEAALDVSGSSRSRLRRVFAAVSPDALLRAALESDETEIVIWVDNLEEVDPANGLRLQSYARAIEQLRAAGKRPFALYGGFFSAALRTLGLRGASHGIGFSEHRYHVELKSSGGAPARFYVQRIHRYLSVDLARDLWRNNPRLVESYFAGYDNRDPGEYDYHGLMKLSVYARADEIQKLENATAEDVAAELLIAKEGFDADLAAAQLSVGVRKRAESYVAHLPVWARALRSG